MTRRGVATGADTCDAGHSDLPNRVASRKLGLSFCEPEGRARLVLIGAMSTSASRLAESPRAASVNCWTKAHTSDHSREPIGWQVASSDHSASDAGSSLKDDRASAESRLNASASVKVVSVGCGLDVASEELRGVIPFRFAFAVASEEPQW